MKSIVARPLKNTLFACCLAAVLANTAPAIAAAAYPARPVRFVVPFSPGGNADTVARIAAQKIGESLGQQVVIDNRSGGNGNIGMEIVARAAPDGYSVVLGYISNVAIAPSLIPGLPFDPVKDFAPITQLASAQNIVAVHPSVAARDLKELVALSKNKPGAINFSSAGVGTVGHLTGAYLNTALGANLQHVPYRGGGQSVTDLVANQIQMVIGGMASFMPYIKSGRLHALAVTGAKRSAAAPDVPTIAESLIPGFEATAWYGVLAPAGTPHEIVTRLHAEFAKAMAAPETRQRLEPLGFEIVASNPAQFAAYIKTETVKWAKVVKVSGAKAE